MFNKKLFFIFCLIFLIGVVSAQPPFETNINTNDGLQVFYPQFENIQKNSTFMLHVHITNISNGMPLANTNIDCFVHLYNTTGDHTFESLTLTKDANGYDHEIFIDEGNFTDIGDHAFFIWCNNTFYGGSVRGTFLVTESGIEMTEGRSILSIGLLIILVLFFFISLYALFSVEDYRGKFTLYWVSHVLIVLTFFVGWQLGVEGLLTGTALVGIFRVLFYFFTVAIFPMLLLSIAWMFYIHTVNDHMKKLMEKGEDPETAFKIAKKKSRRRRY